MDIKKPAAYPGPSSGSQDRLYRLPGRAEPNMGSGWRVQKVDGIRTLKTQAGRVNGRFTKARLRLQEFR